MEFSDMFRLISPNKMEALGDQSTNHGLKQDKNKHGQHVRFVRMITTSIFDGQHVRRALRKYTYYE